MWQSTNSLVRELKSNQQRSESAMESLSENILQCYHALSESLLRIESQLQDQAKLQATFHKENLESLSAVSVAVTEMGNTLSETLQQVSSDAKNEVTTQLKSAKKQVVNHISEKIVSLSEQSEKNAEMNVRSLVELEKKVKTMQEMLSVLDEGTRVIIANMLLAELEE